MKNLTNAILARDKQAINNCLRLLKTDTGSVNFNIVLAGGERLPQMFKRDPKQTAGLIVVSLTLAFESMNLSRPMNEDQILDLADAIIDTSGEDYLSIEDLVLFLQGLTRGKYGPLYESMDIPKFMEKFEIYRQERHEAYQGIKYEQNAQLKSFGPTERESDNNDREKDLMREAVGDHLRSMYKDKKPE